MVTFERVTIIHVRPSRHTSSRNTYHAIGKTRSLCADRECMYVCTYANATLKAYVKVVLDAPCGLWCGAINVIKSCRYVHTLCAKAVSLCDANCRAYHWTWNVLFGFARSPFRFIFYWMRNCIVVQILRRTQVSAIVSIHVPRQCELIPVVHCVASDWWIIRWMCFIIWIILQMWIIWFCTISLYET